jgi:hypothetical protein
MRTPGFVEAQVKRLARNHITANFMDGSGNLYGLEGPVYYTMGRMLDDPDNNQARQLVKEFCSAAFGSSAPLMQQFYDKLYHGIEPYSLYLGTHSPAWTYADIYGKSRKLLTDPFQMLGFLYTPDLLTALDTFLMQAEKLTTNAGKVKTRLALVRREFDYLKSLAHIVHLYHAYQIQPDMASRERLLAAIDSRNAMIDAYYDSKGRPKAISDWAFVIFPPIGHSAKHLRLGYDGYQDPFANTPLNWDTKAVRSTPMP